MFCSRDFVESPVVKSVTPVETVGTATHRFLQHTYTLYDATNTVLTSYNTCNNQSRTCHWRSQKEP